MRSRHILGLCALSLLLAVAACGGPAWGSAPLTGSGQVAPITPPSQPRPPVAPTGQSTPTADFHPRVEVVASHLEIPWALAFATRLPGSDPQASSGPLIFVTERPGRIRLVIDGRLRPEPVAVLPVAAEGEGGLMGLDLDLHFDRNGYLYVMYTRRGSAGLRNRISRLTLHGMLAGEEKVLLDDIPAGTLHDGGRLKLGPDGKLYATTGENTLGLPAQSLASLAGKILRLNPDGTVPADNPFPGSPVYSYGHRNPQGLAWQPGTGQLFSAEHGPSKGIDADRCCHDEINRIVPGANYGWPAVAGAAGDPHFVDPIYESGDDTWAPSGLAFYDADVLAAWKGSLFFGALRGLHLHRLVLGGPGNDRVVGEERLFEGAFGRIRDVAVGSDGALYFTTSNRDYRWPAGPDDDRILRVVPGQ